MQCPYCEQDINSFGFSKHLCNYHTDKFNEQIELAKKLFFDDNFSETTISNYPEVLFNYDYILNIWKQTYSSKERQERMIRCTAMHNAGKNIKKKLIIKGKAHLMKQEKKCLLAA